MDPGIVERTFEKNLEKIWPNSQIMSDKEDSRNINDEHTKLQFLQELKKLKHWENTTSEEIHMWLVGNENCTLSESEKEDENYSEDDHAVDVSHGAAIEMIDKLLMFCQGHTCTITEDVNTLNALKMHLNV